MTSPDQRLSPGHARSRLELAPFAEFELESRQSNYARRVAEGRMSADEAGRGIAAWRTIVTLLRCGEAGVEPCLGEDCPRTWPALVKAAALAAEHRLDRALVEGGDEACRRSAALRSIRDLLMRSAIRQGAVLPSFDPLATVGVDGPGTRKAA